MQRLVSALLLAAVVGAEPIVKLEIGNVVGIERYIQEVAIESFLGLPYAEPPEGNLRFALPKPFGPLGNFQAKKYGAPCAQPAISSSNFATAANSKEDCLYLNVHRKKSTKAGDRKPVIVVIHGGSFSHGSGSDLAYNPAPLAAFGDAITISLNYRLGVFGFADMGSFAPKNLGFYDQRLALEWIQDHIEAFGGDPGKVTLLGVSAGSMSISAQITAGLNSARALFHSVIMDSGIIGLGLKASTERNKQLIRKISLELGCQTEGEEMLACLRKASEKDLNRLQFDRSRIHRDTTFASTIDDIFVTEDMVQLGGTKNIADEFTKVRMMVGMAEEEGRAVLDLWRATNPLNLGSEDEFLNEIAIIAGDHGTEQLFGDPNVRRRVLAAYYEPYSDPFLGIVRFFGDVRMVCRTNSFVEDYSKHNSKVFYYHFERKLRGTYLGFGPSSGAFHGSAFMHFLGVLLDAGVELYDDDEDFFMDSVELVSKFAWGNDSLQLRGVKWSSFSEKPQFLRIRGEPLMDEGVPFASNCALFKSDKEKPHVKDEF